MNNTECITVNDEHSEKIESLNYLPVGLGENIRSKNFLRDNFGKHISHKNSFYGEYTFHYWFGKCYTKSKENEWIGFCQYRKFWIKSKKKINPNTFEALNKNILKTIDGELENYESVLGEDLYINQLRLSKFIKKNPKMMIKNPVLFFNKNKRNIKFHFDMFHGEGILDKAIMELDNENRADFGYFVNSEVSFNPHNMFICKSSKILKKYYEVCISLAGKM